MLLTYILSPLRNLWFNTNKDIIKIVYALNTTLLLSYSGRTRAFFSANLIHFMPGICTMEIQIWQCFLHTGHLQTSTPNPALHNRPLSEGSLHGNPRGIPIEYNYNGLLWLTGLPTLLGTHKRADPYNMPPASEKCSALVTGRARTWPVPLSSWSLLMQKWP